MWLLEARLHPNGCWHHLRFLATCSFLFFFFAASRAQGAALPVKIPLFVRPKVPPNATRTHVPSPSPKPRMNLLLPKNVKKLYINVSPSLSPTVPPEYDESVAVLVLEPNAGVARQVRKKMRKKLEKMDAERKIKHKKTSNQSSRLIVLNYAIEGPPQTDVLPTFQSLNLDRGAPGSVPVLTLDEILNSLPSHLELEVM